MGRWRAGESGVKGDAPKRPAPAGEPARRWASPWVRRLAVVLASAYLLAIWLEAVWGRLPGRVLPPSLRFFIQVAELFPRAATDAIEWRARGWRCDLGRFEEIDVRPFFPIHRDDKESRFHRAMFFYARQPKVLEALNAYITTEQNRLHPDARIGGVMLLSLRIPIPPLGMPGPRHERLPISEYPPSVTRRYWYTASVDARTGRCAEAP
jgi:hypothetical protein